MEWFRLHASSTMSPALVTRNIWNLAHGNRVLARFPGSGLTGLHRASRCPDNILFDHVEPQKHYNFVIFACGVLEMHSGTSENAYFCILGARWPISAKNPDFDRENPGIPGFLGSSSGQHSYIDKTNVCARFRDLLIPPEKNKCAEGRNFS